MVRVADTVLDPVPNRGVYGVKETVARGVLHLAVCVEELSRNNPKQQMEPPRSSERGSRC